MKTRLWWISLFILLTTLLSACGITQSSTIGPCIKPAFNLAFPTYAPAQPGSFPVKKILPGGSWRIETNLPDIIPDTVDSLVMRHGNEIWMVVSQLQGDNHVYRYRTDTHKWSSYSSIDSMSTVPQALFVSSDDTLWGVGLSGRLPELLSSNNSWSYLSRFDDASNQFRFVKDNQGKLQSVTAPRYPPMIVGDQSGNLWMILDNGASPTRDTTGGLYQFDPATGKLTHHLPEVQLSGYGSLAISSNNDVWILEPTSEAKLIQFNPATGKHREDFINLHDWKIQDWYGDLYFDRSGKLWSGNDGWLDLTNPDIPVWYKIIPSSVFISDYYDGGDQYIWTHPSHIFQSLNGWYWFSGSNGIVRLNIETGEWCRFTTEDSPVVEDDQKNIRIVVEGRIYIYK